VEHRFHPDSQMSGHHGLGDSVGDGGDAQRPRPVAVLFGYLHHTHRRWKVGPRREPIPDLVKIVLQIGLKLFDGDSIHSGCTFVLLHLLEGLPDLPLRDIKRLALRFQLVPPVPSGQFRLTE
jgi:hypothetical protein